MVNLKQWKKIISLSALGFAALPAAADGILEQMQNEVAAIAGRTRTAVVTVEDERAVAGMNDFSIFFSEDHDIATLGGARRLAADKLKLIDGDMKTLDIKIQNLTQQFSAGLISLDALDAVNQQKAHLKLERTALLPLLSANFNAFADINSYALLADQLAELTQKQVEAQENVAKLKETYKDAHPKLRAAVEMARAYQKRAEEIQQKLKVSDKGENQTTRWAMASLPRSGTGFCIGEGYIVTTADVVEGMVRPVIVTDAGARIKAKVVGVNPDMNVGLLQMQAKTELPSLKFGDSASLAVGHFAISVGNQGGQANSVALMLVGGLRTEGTYSGSRFYPRLIQIAGTVGAGTSGAPLVNARGEAVGVMVAVPTNVNFVQSVQRARTFSSSPTVNGRAKVERGNTATMQGRQEKKPETQEFVFQVTPGRSQNTVIPRQPALPNVPMFNTAGRFFNSANPAQIFTAQLPVTSAGYAIPINDLKPVIEQLRTGKITRGWIGIAPTDMERVFETDGVLHIERTVKVEGIFPDSPAFHAKLLPGDVLIELDGKPVQSAADIRAASLRVRPGDTVSLAFRRAGDTKSPSPRQMTLRVTLKIEPRPAEPNIKPAITATVKEEPVKEKP